MEFKAAPLPHEWMIISIIGFFVSLLQVYPYVDEKWGAAFMLLFILMFIASIISMTAATTDPDHIDALSSHYRSKPQSRLIAAREAARHQRK
jgi:hypothetical protein